jgi:hypothetical protein
MNELIPFAGGLPVSAVAKYSEQFLAGATGHKGESFAKILGEKVFEWKEANAE